MWTLDELAAQSALALSADYTGTPDDRIRAIPDRRTIRYYTTLGLLDRAAEMRGRTALYGRRHLLQLVAIKRLQVRGLTLAEVQQHLVGRSDAELERIARLPAGLDAPTASRAPATASNRAAEAFWRTPPADVADRPAGGEERAASSSGQTVPLSEDVLLALLSPARPIEEDDLEALRVAAAPLLKVLEKRNLLQPRGNG